MRRKKMFLHALAILAICFFSFMAIGSFATRPAAVVTGEETVVASETKTAGWVHNMPEPLNKDYQILGLVFAKSETRFSDEGRIVSSQEGIITMLLREVQRLGGEDIFNLRIDENITDIRVTSSDGRVGYYRVITHTGSALAIRYIN